MVPSTLRPQVLRRESIPDRPALRYLRRAGVARADPQWNWRPATLRALLIAGCALAVGVAAWAGDPSAYLHADPALARVLRCMALIKGLIALAAVGAVLWRLKWPISAGKYLAYMLGSCVIVGATMLVWQLTAIVSAAVLFHAAALGMLLLGWRER